MEDNEFYIRVAQTLGACQLVEEVLKLYFTEALQLERKLKTTGARFKLVSRNYKDRPLGALIEPFKTYSGNHSLAKSLGEFKEDRNFVAHEVITICLDPDGELDSSAVDEFERLGHIQSKARELWVAVREELVKVRVELYFDDLGPATNG